MEVLELSRFTIELPMALFGRHETPISDVVRESRELPQTRGRVTAREALALVYPAVLETSKQPVLLLITSGADIGAEGESYAHMLSIQSLNERTPTCGRCDGRFRVVLPAKSDQDSLALVFARSRIEFISALRDATGCGLADATGVAGHVASAVGHCHSCNGEIRDRLLVDCPRCRALNIQLGRSAADVTCPACGFAVLSDGYGSDEICEICGWQDDAVQLANPTSAGGANRRSLAEAQAEIVARIPVSVTLQGEFQRDPLWRPLDAPELAAAEAKRRLQHWHTSAARDRDDVYWLQAPASARQE